MNPFRLPIVFQFGFCVGLLANTPFISEAFGASVGAGCLLPLVDSGKAFADSSAGFILVSKSVPPHSFVIAVAHRGKFFGCTAEEQKLSQLIGKGSATTRVSVYLPFRMNGSAAGGSSRNRDSVAGHGVTGVDVTGVEATVTAAKRLLFGRALTVPWDLVDRKSGLTARCSSSTEARFEAFMNAELLATNSRRCSLTEIQEITGRL